MSTPRKKRLKPKPNSSASPSVPEWAVNPPQTLLPSKQDLLRLLSVVIIASSVALVCKFIVQLFNPTIKPFCDSGDSFSDTCQPCPSNGECYQGKLECFQGYRRQGNLCIEDGDIHHTAKKLSELVEYRLCKGYAEVLCGGPGSIWVPDADISKDVDEHELMKNFETNDAIRLYAEKRTMETISSLLESRINLYGIKEWKCPDLIAERYKPITCRVHQWVSKHVFVIVPVCVLLVVCILLLWRIRQRRYLSIRVEELYHQVCEILEETALTSKSENGEPWVVASRLRDHLLLPKERKDPVIWKKVEDLVKEDSRVDQYPKLLKGESKVVWEWQVEGSLSSSRKRRKVEANKLKCPENRVVAFDQQHHKPKAEPRSPIF